MQVAIFVDEVEIIIVPLNPYGTPVDKDGTLFGRKSGRDIDCFERDVIDVGKGESAIIELRPPVVRVHP